MAGLDIKLSKVDGEEATALAEMTGAIDGNTVSNFQEKLEQIKAEGHRRLVLDMSKIKYVNSTGLGSLVKYADSFKQSGGGMALIKVPAKVKIVIEMLGLNAFFDICPDLDGALAALKGGGGGGAAAPAADTGKSSSGVLPPRTTSGRAPTQAPRQVTVAPPAATTIQTSSVSTGGGSWPRAVDCQGCHVQIELPGAGNWKCPRCYTSVVAKPDGSHRFGAVDRPVPINVSLTASADCGEGLVHLVTSVCTQSFNGQQNKLHELRVAVHEVATVMQRLIYQNNPQGIYHVSIEREAGRVQIRFSDSGNAVDSNRSTQFFPHASSTMAEFECRAHPSGGNTIRLVQRA
ncbi:MAG: STAS domain-containing protein [Planctomycetes bacterium]|nr:STAS domain-containing protein [Planctomycetota bacterium]